MSEAIAEAFRSAATGLVDGDTVEVFLHFYDPGRFATLDGQPDAAAIKTQVNYLRQRQHYGQSTQASEQARRRFGDQAKRSPESGQRQTGTRPPGWAAHPPLTDQARAQLLKRGYLPPDGGEAA